MGRARHVIWPNQKKTCILVIVINNEPIMSSMMAAGIVQDTFAGEAGEGERGRRSGDDWTLLQTPWPKILPFSLQFEFLSLVIRLFRIQYKTPIAEAYDYFRNSTLDEIARWKK